VESFLNSMQKFRLKIPYRYREIVKKRKDFTQMTSMAMLTQSENPSGFVRI